MSETERKMARSLALHSAISVPLVKRGRITYETGLEKCHHIEDFNRLTGR